MSTAIEFRSLTVGLRSAGLFICALASLQTAPAQTSDPPIRSLGGVSNRVSKQTNEELRLVREQLVLAKKAEDNRDYLLAIGHYKAALAIYPHLRSLHVHLGRVYDRLGQKENALQSYRQAFIVPAGERGSPADGLLEMSRFAELSLELRHPDEAKLIYDRFAQYKKWSKNFLAIPTPHGSSINALRAHSYLVIADNKRYKGQENAALALDFVNKALQLFPRDWIALHVKVSILHRLHDKKEAKVTLRQAMKLAPRTYYDSLKKEAVRFRLVGGSSQVSSLPDGRTRYRTVIIYPDGTREESERIESRRSSGG